MANQDGLDDSKPSPEKGRFKNRSTKCVAFIIASALLKILILAVLLLTVLPFKNPDIKLESPTLENMSMANSGAHADSMSNMTLKAEIAIKNRNWGKFKYGETSMVLSYEGSKVGEGEIPKGKVKMRSSKRVGVVLEMNFDGLIRADDSGTLVLNSYAKISGEVHMVMMEMIKKRRSGEVNCSLTISLSSKTIQDYSCR